MALSLKSRDSKLALRGEIDVSELFSFPKLIPLTEGQLVNVLG